MESGILDLGIFEVFRIPDFRRFWDLGIFGILGFGDPKFWGFLGFGILEFGVFEIFGIFGFWDLGSQILGGFLGFGNFGIQGF